MQKIDAILEGVAARLAPILALFARVTFGWQIYESGRGKFFVQGMDKVAGFFDNLGIPLPELNAYLAASAELVGGSLLILGLFTRIACVPLMITMIVAFATAHTSDAKTIGDFFGISAIGLLAGFGIVFVYGPGSISLDHLFFKKTK